MYDVYQTELFQNQFQSLSKEIQKEADSIIKKLQNGSETGKPLKGLLKDCKTVRVKREYRLVFRFHGSQNRLELISIGYRKKFYKELERLKRKGYL